MIEALKNFARTVLALPPDAGIFLERPVDSVERWQWCRKNKLVTIAVFISEKELTSEMLLRTAIALEPDLRNRGMMVLLSAGQSGVRELMASLSIKYTPEIVLTDREGKPLRYWGTLANPLEVIESAAAAARAA